MGLQQKITTTSKVITAGFVVLVMFGQALQSRHEAASADPAAPHHKRMFEISGVVGRLYPGKHTVLVVRVRNHQAFPISPRRITARVRRPSAHCAAGNVRVTPFTGRRRITARRSIRVRLHILMKQTAPNGCQGLRFPLIYHGKAVRA